jgi:ATP-dependent RNA helicase DeaD
VLDEADRMLDMGFIDDVERILQQTGRRQIAFFSATMPDEVRKLARRHMKNPREVLIESDDLNVKEIKQLFCQADRDTKLDALLKILHDKTVQRAIVFCRTKRTTFWLTESLRRRHVNATAINGDLSQNQRDRAMEGFRSGHSRILVATDLAGRGLDIDGVTHIINYDVPEDPLTYFHRIGRTGRAGKTGTAVTIVSADQSADFRAIETLADYQIERLEIGKLERNTFTPESQRAGRFHEETRARFNRGPYRHARRSHDSLFRGMRGPSGASIENLRP